MSKVLNWTKRPITVQAIQFETYQDYSNIVDFVGKENLFVSFIKSRGEEIINCVFSVKTLEGYMGISLGDYLIKGVNGEFYPCKPEIFEKTYMFHSNVVDHE